MTKFVSPFVSPNFNLVREPVRMAKKKLKLTWQKGTSGRSGRWRKMIKGQTFTSMEATASRTGRLTKLPSKSVKNCELKFCPNQRSQTLKPTSLRSTNGRQHSIGVRRIRRNWSSLRSQLARSKSFGGD